MAGIELEDLRHINLLYFYRNSLVHEVRVPGYGIEFSDDTAPYYSWMDEIDAAGDTKRSTWELIYPVKFFSHITTNCLKNLELYLKSNDLNPLASYALGTYWLKELNVEDN